MGAVLFTRSTTGPRGNASQDNEARKNEAATHKLEYAVKLVTTGIKSLRRALETRMRHAPQDDTNNIDRSVSARLRTRYPRKT